MKRRLYGLLDGLVYDSFASLCFVVRHWSACALLNRNPIVRWSWVHFGHYARYGAQPHAKRR